MVALKTCVSFSRARSASSEAQFRRRPALRDNNESTAALGLLAYTFTPGFICTKSSGSLPMGTRSKYWSKQRSWTLLLGALQSSYPSDETLDLRVAVKNSIAPLGVLQPTAIGARSDRFQWRWEPGERGQLKAINPPFI
ncbi:hypothetical protein F0562_003411 [Nyssa sinensis]|uniref:Uncharacterized protein n=1 Tax=Nyssa sinensis TaxID=561372 RepID=A0A5J5BZC3_9ASTE|nr:hypothetical protein F0562_003411 [Nyssa sinensis]